jgi:hypothetical protein
VGIARLETPIERQEQEKTLIGDLYARYLSIYFFNLTTETATYYIEDLQLEIFARGKPIRHGKTQILSEEAQQSQAY